jgi:hypothetical protein
MRQTLVSVFAFASVVVCVSAQQTIWLIRHCDKPATGKSPCCSSQGFDRASGWGSYFTQGVLDGAGFLASNYKDPTNTVCRAGITPPSKIKGTCQSSQRMYLLAYLLAQKVGHPTNAINTQWCSGLNQEPQVASYLQGQKKNQLVVWEHGEIPDIISGFGINIGAWPKTLDVYNIVFRLQRFSSKGGWVLTWGCFNYQTKTTTCEAGASAWLSGFGHISSPLAVVSSRVAGLPLQQNVPKVPQPPADTKLKRMKKDRKDKRDGLKKRKHRGGGGNTLLRRRARKAKHAAAATK